MGAGRDRGRADPAALRGGAGRLGRRRRLRRRGRWDTVTVAALGVPFDRAQYRIVRTLSGGEQKRLALEALLRGPDEVLLLDEPDNYLDVPGKRWLEQRLAETPKTVLFVSHDRELLARTADRVVTVEAHSTWVHGGGFGTYAAAREARIERLDELHRRWEEEHTGSRSWSGPCSSRRRSARRWRRSTGPCRRGWPSSRRPGRRRNGRSTSRCRCGCAAGAPACAR